MISPNYTALSWTNFISIISRATKFNLSVDLDTYVCVTISQSVVATIMMGYHHTSEHPVALMSLTLYSHAGWRTLYSGWLPDIYVGIVGWIYRTKIDPISIPLSPYFFEQWSSIHFFSFHGNVLSLIYIYHGDNIHQSIRGKLFQYILCSSNSRIVAIAII